MRIVPRVADPIYGLPGGIPVRAGACSRCGKPVVCDEQPPDGMTGGGLVCDRCVAASPDLRAMAPAGFVERAERTHRIVDQYRARQAN